MKRRAGVLPLLLVLAAACGNGGSRSACPAPEGLKASPAPASSPTGFVEASSETGRLCVTVRGAVTIDFDRVVALQIAIAGEDPRIPRNLRLLSVGLLKHVTLEGDRQFRLAFDLLGYTKDRRYTIPATGTQSQVMGAQLPPGIASNAFVELLQIAPPAPGFVRYDILGKPCDLEVRRRGREGRLVCPQIKHASEGEISLRMEWQVPKP